MNTPIDLAFDSERRSALTSLLLGAIAAAYPGLASADKFPSKPFKVVVGSPPAALGDVVSRLMADKIREVTNQNAIVDNRAGASGLIAGELVSKAPGDGTTVLIAPDNVMVVNPYLYAKPRYDPVSDFQPISILGKASLVVIASPKLGVKSFAELITLVKANPKMVNYSSGGIGHVTHMGLELAADRLGLQMTHVPYKGTAPALQAVLAGEVGIMLVGIAGAVPQIKAGRAIPLVASGPASKDVFPNLPEMKDSHPDLDISVWFGIFAPATTPPDITAALNKIFIEVLKKPDVIKKLGEYGMSSDPSTPAQLTALVKADRERFGPLIKSLGIKAE